MPAAVGSFQWWQKVKDCRVVCCGVTLQNRSVVNSCQSRPQLLGNFCVTVQVTQNPTPANDSEQCLAHLYVT